MAFWIRKNNTNKRVDGLPSAYPSRRVTYGNTNVEAELDTINSNLSYNTPDHEYTATANMTGSQVLTWLNNNIDASKINLRSRIVMGGSMYYPTISGRLRFFSMAGLTSTNIYSNSFDVIGGIWIRSDGTNYINEVMVGAGQKIEVYY